VDHRILDDLSLLPGAVLIIPEKIHRQIIGTRKNFHKIHIGRNQDITMTFTIILIRSALLLLP
jgi:hypothetical protein